MILVVEAQQGQILCENEPGIDATLHLALPIEPAQIPKDPGGGRG
jgi:hypothetical protein